MRIDNTIDTTLEWLIAVNGASFGVRELEFVFFFRMGKIYFELSLFIILIVTTNGIGLVEWQRRKQITTSNRVGSISVWMRQTKWWRGMCGSRNVAHIVSGGPQPRQALGERENWNCSNSETATFIRLSTSATNWRTTNKRKCIHFEFFVLSTLQDRRRSPFYFTQKRNHCDLCDFHKLLFNTKDPKPKNENIKAFSVFRFVPLDLLIACGYWCCFDLAILSLWFIFNASCGYFRHSDEHKHGHDTNATSTHSMWRKCIVSINMDSPMCARKFN